MRLDRGNSAIRHTDIKNPIPARGRINNTAGFQQNIEWHDTRSALRILQGLRLTFDPATEP
jgi:hypothetical protein